jgi:1-acyl-sn-glycerol-3-phosphate acyltransferase
MNIWYQLIKLIFWVYRLLFIRKVKVSGLENIIPGPKIIVANHPNMTDSLVLPFILPENPTFLIQANTFSLPLFGFLLRKSGQIPVARGRGRLALDEALKRLARGETVVIFPEGKLNHGETLCRAGSGAAVLAKRSGAPVLPIGFYVSPQDKLVFTAKIHGQKRSAHWQVRGCCYVHIGEPWQVEKTQQAEIPGPGLRAITKKMMALIADLVQEAEHEAQASHGRLGLDAQIPPTAQLNKL